MVKLIRFVPNWHRQIWKYEYKTHELIDNGQNKTNNTKAQITVNK